MTSFLKHFIFTRLGIGITSPSWLNRHLDVFEAVTLPSLLHQSDLRFHWLIGIDAGMPREVRARLDALLSDKPFIHLLPIRGDEILRMQIGSFDWLQDIGVEYILGNGLLTDPSEFVITSIIDADDGWHVDTVKSVQQLMLQLLPPLSAARPAGYLLCHSPGVVLTFTRGVTIDLFSRHYEVREEELSSMSVFVISRLSSNITACSARHKSWFEFGKVVGFPVKALPTEQPMWFYSRHGDAMSAAVAPPSDAAVLEDTAILSKLFGIDIDRLNALKEPPASPTLTELSQEDSRPLKQLDASYRLAGRNRQIRALERRVSGNPSLTSVLREARAMRDELLADYQRRGAEEFF